MPINYDSTLERMLQAGRFKNTSALARDLNVTPQAFSNYKVRGYMPADLCVEFADKHGLSIDWLIRGAEVMSKDALPEPGPLETGPLSLDELIAVGKTLNILRSGNALKLALNALLDSVRHEKTVHMELSALSTDFPEVAASGIAAAINEKEASL